MAMSKEELLAKLQAQRERNAGGSVAPRSEPSTVPQASEPVPSAAPSSVALAMLAKKKAALLAAEAAQAEAARIASLPPPKAAPLATSPELAQRCEPLVAACQSLADALLQQEPTLGSFLADIHEHLRAEPELMHIMSDEQIAAVYKGFIAQSGKQVIATKAKKATAKAIALKEAEDDGL